MRLHRKASPATALRRGIEATIEAKARKRRSKEVEASSALRRDLGFVPK
jgi:hypothetical protein